MLKLIRLSGNIYTVLGQGVPKGKIPLGSIDDCTEYLQELGVSLEETLVALEYLRDYPGHNAVDFGALNGVTCSYSHDTSGIMAVIEMTEELPIPMELAVCS